MNFWHLQENNTEKQSYIQSKFSILALLNDKLLYLIDSQANGKPDAIVEFLILSKECLTPL